MLGIGLWGFSGKMGPVTDKICMETIRAAIDFDMKLFDTSPNYGFTERCLGKALSVSERDGRYICTKLSGHNNRIDVRRSVHRSLKRLQVEYLDLCTLHEWKSRNSALVAIDELKSLQEKGLIRRIGVSNLTSAEMNEACGRARISTIQVGFNLFDSDLSDNLTSTCLKRDIRLMAYSPLAKGLLGRPYSMDQSFEKPDERARLSRFKRTTFAHYVHAARLLQDFAMRERRSSLTQLALAWVMHNPAVSSVVVSPKSPADFRDYIIAQELKLSSSEMKALQRIAASAARSVIADRLIAMSQVNIR